MKKHGFIFTIESGQFLCWVLTVFMLDGHHVAILNI